MKKNVILPKFIQAGIKKNSPSALENVLLFGADTETVNGEAHTLQVTGVDGSFLYYVNKHTIFTTFVEHIDARLKRGHTAAVYFHNLNFDLPVLFSREKLKLWQGSQFEVERDGWKCYVNCEKRFFAKLSKQNNKRIQIIDSFGFLPTSLARVSESLGLNLPKLEKPEGLGTLPLRTPEFEAYAKRDADIDFHFARWIENIHRQYNIKLTVSLPQMGAYIFKSMFLRKGDVIEFPPMNVVKPSLLSYHGGKNGFYVKPGVYKNCSEIDINSAYPYAMKQLPSFLKGTYACVKRFVPELCGVYRISGRINCPYNLLFDHGFKPVSGEFKNLWVTGYEIAEGLKYNELEIDDIFGHVWVPDAEETRNPFGDYVDYFYQKRQETPKSDPMSNFFKLAMNANYGKLIQCVEKREEVDIDTPDFNVNVGKDGKLKIEERVKNFTAGGMFQPFIASQITAKVRVMLHGLEHRFKAIHAATDSIKTLEPIVGGSKALGDYKLEVTGTCVLLRNKLYLHYAKDFSHCGHKPGDPGVIHKNGEHLCKFALHGFTGRVGDLDRLISTRTQTYEVKHLYKIREAIRQRKDPLTMITMLKRFHFDWTEFNKNGGKEWQ